MTPGNKPEKDEVGVDSTQKNSSLYKIYPLTGGVSQTTVSTADPSPPVSATPSTEVINSTGITSSVLPVNGKDESSDTMLTSEQITSQLPDPEPQTRASYDKDLLSSLSEGDKALFESVVETLAESDPRVRDLNPIDVIMSLNMTSDSLGGLLGGSPNDI